MSSRHYPVSSAVDTGEFELGYQMYIQFGDTVAVFLYILSMNCTGNTLIPDMLLEFLLQKYAIQQR